MPKSNQIKSRTHTQIVEPTKTNKQTKTASLSWELRTKKARITNLCPHVSGSPDSIQSLHLILLALIASNVCNFVFLGNHISEYKNMRIIFPL